MRRRARAIAFAAGALVCAGLAAALTGAYHHDIQTELGPLRRVVVAAARIPGGQPVSEKGSGHLLVVRRVPARFAPPGALTEPEQAVGRAPAAAIPAGSYVIAAQLRDPNTRHHPSDEPRLVAGRRPVEISVTGAEALVAGRSDPAGSRVDVIVTTEPGPGGGPGRTYVAAKGVRLLGLVRSDGHGADYTNSDADTWTATLGLTRSQALRLIQAESFARGVRLIGT